MSSCSMEDHLGTVYYWAWDVW